MNTTPHLPATIDAWIERYSETLIAGAINIAAAAAILIVGLWIAGLAARWMKRLAQRHSRIDSTLAAFFSSIVRYAIVAFVLLAVLRRFGVETTSIVAVLGAAALAIGLALQGTLSNLAAGVMLVLFRPYRIGDFVETAGRMGTVEDITLFTTELATLDNLKLVIPNGLCWGAPILNYSAKKTRRTEIIFSISYDSDIGKAMNVIAETLDADARVFSDPAPFIKVNNLGDFSVDIIVRFWTTTDVAFDAKLELLQKMKEAFDRAGIVIPFPTATNYEVRVNQDSVRAG